MPLFDILNMNVNKHFLRVVYVGMHKMKLSYTAVLVISSLSLAGAQPAIDTDKNMAYPDTAGAKRPAGKYTGWNFPVNLMDSNNRCKDTISCKTPVCPPEGNSPFDKKYPLWIPAVEVPAFNIGL